MAEGVGHRRLLRAAETGIAGGVCSDVARHVATKTVGSAIDRCDAGLAWYAHGEAVGGGIFALRRPRPYSRAFAGIPLRRIASDHHLRPHGHQRERRMGG